MNPHTCLPSTPRHVLVCCSPNAGSRPGWPHVKELTERLTSSELHVEAITDIDELAAKARHRLQQGDLRGVVAAGGDGTVGLVANHTPPGTPITVLPLGTENLLAKHLGLPRDPQTVWRTVLEGETLQLDAGEAGGRLFSLMIGCGFDADVVRRLHAERKGHIQHFSYAKPIWESIRHYDYPDLRVFCDPPQAPAGCPLTAKWVFVVNVPRYAGGLRIAPDAVADDGWLDLCTFQRGSLLSGMRYLGGVVFGQHRSFADVQSLRVQRLRIESDEPVPFQMDGDPGGELPVEIKVVPNRLTLIRPKERVLPGRLPEADQGSAGSMASWFPWRWNTKLTGSSAARSNCSRVAS